MVATACFFFFFNFIKMYKKLLPWGIELIELLFCGSFQWNSGPRRCPEGSYARGMWIISFEKPQVEHCVLLVLSRLIPNGIKNSRRFTQRSGCENSVAELNRLHYISKRALMGFSGAQPKNIMSLLCIPGWLG